MVKQCVKLADTERAVRLTNNAFGLFLVAIAFSIVCNAEFGAVFSHVVDRKAQNERFVQQEQSLPPVLKEDQHGQSLRQKRVERVASAATDDWKVTRYSQKDISETVKNFRGNPVRLLYFDGEDDSFNMYNLAVGNNYTEFPGYQDRWCTRCPTIVPFLVDALRTNFPERFFRGAKPFQLPISANDCVSTDCANNPKKCHTSNFAPLISFGTVYKDPSILPTVKAFPLVFYMKCLFNWRSENLQTPEECAIPTQSTAVPWRKLKPQVIWRGTDFRFATMLWEFQLWKRGRDIHWAPDLTKKQAVKVLLDEWDHLTPRLRGVTLSLQSETEANNDDLPWIDCKFVQQDHNQFDASTTEGHYLLGDRVELEEMAQYRYQIDFGGVGGTTWLGTITKLAMPGVLFHHETPMRDWFFDEIKPWVHYIPVKVDLSDLKEQFDWAEANPDKAQEISKAGTDFALSMISKDYMRDTYKKYFVRYLGRLVDAYDAGARENKDSMLHGYEADGYEVHQVAHCEPSGCVTRFRLDTGDEYSLPLGFSQKLHEMEKERFDFN